MADEEERLMRAMANRQNKAFEEKRKQALAGYQGKAANFQLSTEESEKAKEAVKKQLSNPVLEPSGKSQVASPRSFEPVSSGAGAFSRGESQSTSSSQAPAASEPRGAGYSGAGTSDATQESLSNYFAKSAQGEEDFQRRREEEERKKQEYLASFGNSLSNYEQQQADRDREFWRRQEEGERAKKEAIASETSAFQAYKQKQEEEEREFRRRREEEDSRKQAQLDAMKQQDEQRRQALLQRQQEEQAARKQRQEQDNAARNSVSCESCRKNMTKTEAVMVKGKQYCYNCSVAASAEKCDLCKKPILGGSTMKAGNKKFHPECLKCGKCGTVLSGGFRMRGTTMLCVNCSAQPL